MDRCEAAAMTEDPAMGIRRRTFQAVSSGSLLGYLSLKLRASMVHAAEAAVKRGRDQVPVRIDTTRMTRDRASHFT
jgi:hypothetical protein